MKVTIDARYVRSTDSEVLPSGGIGRYVHFLVSNLLELDPELRLRLIVPSGNGRPIVDGEHGGRVEEQRFGAPAQSLRTLLSLPRALDVSGVDLLHFPANVLPYVTQRPSLTTVHDIMWLDAPKLCAPSVIKRLVTGSYYRAGIGQAARKSAGVLTVSEASRKALLGRFPELSDRVTVTYHGVDPFFSPIELEKAEVVSGQLVPRGVPFVLCVGQGSPYKNHVRAVRAFAAAFPEGSEVKLCLVRRFTRRDADMRALLARPELAGRVIVLPQISDTELRALYRRARVFLFPSLCEGFGMPSLEAMACGTPVVTASFGAMAEVSADAALGVDTYSTEAIAEGLRRLHEDETLRSALIEKGHARAREFTWRRCAEQTLAAYRAAAR